MSSNQQEKDKQSYDAAHKPQGQREKRGGSGGFLLGDELPNFDVDTTQGRMKLHDYMGEGNWLMLFSHPADFTPVCTTELALAAKYEPEFKKRNVKLVALSCDDVQSHKEWSKDVCSKANVETLPFPIIADSSREIATQLGMLDPDEKDSKGLPNTARAVFVISPSKRLKLSLLYPSSTGRNFDELVRAVDSLQRAREFKVVTPGNWKPGSDIIVPPSVSDDDANRKFHDMKKTELPSGKGYLRFAADPAAAPPQRSS